MIEETAALPLQGLRVATLALNVPGPVTAARLRALGATVVKVEPPGGDPLSASSPAWYRRLSAGQEVVRLNLKELDDRAAFDSLLARTDLLLTSSRPAALERLGLTWAALHERFPRLSQVAIVGHPSPHENRPGHDLTYLAPLGLLSPPHLPPTLLADLAGAERAASAALALLLARERGQETGYAQVALAAVAEDFAEPLRRGLTSQDGVLGGGFAGYNLYQTANGWIALAALEPHFWARVANELGVDATDGQGLDRVFITRDAEEWGRWGVAHDLPIEVVRAP